MDEIQEILEDLEKIQERIKKYLKEQGINDIPTFIPIDPVEPFQPSPFEPNPIVSKCGQCGLDLHQVMGYVCSHPNCPTGLGGSQCTTEGSTIC